MVLFKTILECIQQGFTSGNWLHLQGTSHILIWQEPVQLSSVYSSVVDRKYFIYIFYQNLGYMSPELRIRIQEAS
jgi:hypothetical protein